MAVAGRSDPHTPFIPARAGIQSRAPAYAGASGAKAPSSLRERILVTVLFIAVLASSVAFIEPSPHDALVGLLAVVCVIAGARFDRTLVLPLLLLIVWNVAGLMSLTRVLDQEKTVQYAITSVYLAIAALIFALVVAQNTMPRMTALRLAYVAAAILSALLGIAGYFSLFPGAYDMFTLNSGRATGMFKDPNVFGPFLIWPALYAAERLLNRRIALADLAVAGTILFGLLLSFSRGAWFHFVVSALVVVTLSFFTAPTHKARMRVVTLTVLAVAALAALLVFLLSFSSIGAMFTERAQLIQSYDVGSGGRFRLQEIAVGSVLNFPNGMGPFEFARVNGLQQHNVYLQAFLVYGWVGAMAYILLLVSTMWVGLRASFARTPWQHYAIITLSAFIGEIAEGFIIDTDHWRHFFLLLGLSWGLYAATMRAMRQPNKNPAGMTGGVYPVVR